MTVDESLLSGGPAPPVAPDPGVTEDQISRWSSIYGVQRRQLFRYLEIGRRHEYPAPLDNPVEFATKWWAKPRMKQRVPPNIAAAAAAWRKDAPPDAPVEAPSSSPPAPIGDDLDEPSLDDGEEVRIVRRLVDRFRQKLDEALNDPAKAGEFTQWNTALKDALKTLKEAKASERAQKKESGRFRSTIEVDQQLAEMLRLLVAMRERMGESIRQGILARFPDIAPDHLEAVIEIVLTERAREDQAFQGNPTEDDRFQLTA